MNDWILTVVLIAVLVLAFIIFAVIQKKKQNEIRKIYPGYPKGYWMDQGVGIGVAIGTGIGVALDNLAIGIGIGIAIGAAIGLEREKKHKDEIRPLTEEEKKLRKQSILFMTGILLSGVIIFLLIHFV